MVELIAEILFGICWSPMQCYRCNTNKGSEWASDKLIPVVENNNEDDTHTTLTASDFPPEPYNLYVPETFKDAFDQTCHHLWFPLMAHKIQCWDDREVITPVP
jgi:hypothetical protein